GGGFPFTKEHRSRRNSNASKRPAGERQNRNLPAHRFLVRAACERPLDRPCWKTRPTSGNPPMEHPMKSTLIAIAGAAVGGILGYFAFSWILSKGFYGMILPGGLLGIGAGLGKTRSKWLALAFGAAAICLGLYTEWRFFPLKKDGSLGYFLAHLTELSPV